MRRYRPYSPHGWYKMRNDKIYQQSKRMFADEIALYWGLSRETVIKIIHDERKTRQNAGQSTR